VIVVVVLLCNRKPAKPKAKIGPRSEPISDLELNGLRMVVKKIDDKDAAAKLKVEEEHEKEMESSRRMVVEED